jgi:hypothetical protein
MPQLYRIFGAGNHYGLSTNTLQLLIDHGVVVVNIVAGISSMSLILLLFLDMVLQVPSS